MIACLSIPAACAVLTVLYCILAILGVTCGARTLQGGTPIRDAYLTDNPGHWAHGEFGVTLPSGDLFGSGLNAVLIIEDSAIRRFTEYSLSDCQFMPDEESVVLGQDRYKALYWWTPEDEVEPVEGSRRTFAYVGSVGGAEMGYRACFKSTLLPEEAIAAIKDRTAAVLVQYGDRSVYTLGIRTRRY